MHTLSALRAPIGRATRAACRAARRRRSLRRWLQSHLRAGAHPRAPVTRARARANGASRWSCVTRLRHGLVPIALAFGVSAVSAHGDASHAGKPPALAQQETAFGRAGDPRQVTRTVAVEMRDTMRFSPSILRVKQGDAVRFRVRNAGRLMHEMVLGTRAELEAHAELMRKHPGMEHDAAWMAHVAAGKTETIVWQFTRAGEFFYGCLIPGHFEAGMIGTIIVTKETSK